MFNNDYGTYRPFLDKFKSGKHLIDNNFYLVEALATGLYRPIIILSALKEHAEIPIIKFNHNSNRPPLIYGLYESDGLRVFKLFFFSKNITFNLDSLKVKIEIVAYLSKTVPEGFKS